MSPMHTDREALGAAARAEALLPPDGDLHSDEAQGTSWVLLVLNFLGAQLVVVPFIVFMVLLSHSFFFESPGVWITCTALLVGASLVLRARPGPFFTQLAFSALIAGLAVLIYALDFRQDNAMLWVLLAVLLAVALVVRVAWVQRALGFLAAIVALALNFLSPALDVWTAFVIFPSRTVLMVLAVAWALWCAWEPRWSAHAAARKVAALADGVGVAIVCAAALASTRYFWSLEALMGGGPRGSADEPTAGLAHLFDFGWPVALEWALTWGAAAWLFRHWSAQKPHSSSARAAPPWELLGVVVALFTLAGFVIPQVGVVAMVATIALGTGRRALLGLAGLALLLQLSGFYYALDWPLAHKAALLAGAGAVLGLVLWGLHKRSAPRSTLAPDVKTARQWVAPTAIALAALVAVGLVHRDVQKKEQVIAQGERLYLPLAPRDPRSLMQGDYMALNFAIPADMRDALDARNHANWSAHARVAVRVDPRGVAQVQRLATAGETLAANERLIELKRLRSEWVLVTDAFYFPEGQGAPFTLARFGEFRALPDGRALLVGLADESLRAIAPAPAPAPASQE